MTNIWAEASPIVAGLSLLGLSGCAAAHEGTWQSQDELVVAFVDADYVQWNESVLIETETGSFTDRSSEWTGEVKETDSSLLFLLQCHSRWTHDDTGMSEFHSCDQQAELSCALDGDDVLTCTNPDKRKVKLFRMD